MSWQDFSARNVARCTAATGFAHPLDGWSLDDWILAAGGELGEAMNVAKKLNRVRDGIPGNDKTPEELEAQLADEIADTATYLDLVCHSEGLDFPRELEIARREWAHIKPVGAVSLSHRLLLALNALGNAGMMAEKAIFERQKAYSDGLRSYVLMMGAAIGRAALELERAGEERGFDLLEACESKFARVSAKIGYVPAVAVGAMSSVDGPAMALAMAGGNPQEAAQLWGDSER